MNGLREIVFDCSRSNENIVGTNMDTVINLYNKNSDQLGNIDESLDKLRIKYTYIENQFTSFSALSTA